MSVSLKSLPHFVAEVDDYKVHKFPKYVAYCCINIKNYDYSRGKDYVGTTQTIMKDRTPITLQLRKYTSTFGESETIIRDLFANESKNPNTCYCTVRVRCLELEVTGLKKELNEMKRKFEEFENVFNTSKTTFDTMKQKVDRIPDYLDYDDYGLEVVIEKANTSITQKRLERAISNENPCQGAQAMLIDCGLWPPPKDKTWVELDDEVRNALNEALSFFAEKLIESKGGVVVSENTVEYKNLMRTLRNFFQSKLRDMKKYTIGQIKKTGGDGLQRPDDEEFHDAQDSDCVNKTNQSNSDAICEDASTSGNIQDKTNDVDDDISRFFGQAETQDHQDHELSQPASEPEPEMPKKRTRFCRESVF